MRLLLNVVAVTPAMIADLGSSSRSSKRKSFRNRTDIYKFVHIAEGKELILELEQNLFAHFTRLYGLQSESRYLSIQNSDFCDLDPQYSVQDIFSKNDLVYLILEDPRVERKRHRPDDFDSSSRIVYDSDLRQVLAHHTGGASASSLELNQDHTNPRLIGVLPGSAGRYSMPSKRVRTTDSIKVNSFADSSTNVVSKLGGIGVSNGDSFNTGSRSMQNILASLDSGNSANDIHRQADAALASALIEKVSAVPDTQTGGGNAMYKAERDTEQLSPGVKRSFLEFNKATTPGLTSQGGGPDTHLPNISPDPTPVVARCESQHTAGPEKNEVDPKQAFENLAARAPTFAEKPVPSDSINPSNVGISSRPGLRGEVSGSDSRINRDLHLDDDSSESIVVVELSDNDPELSSGGSEQGSALSHLAKHRNVSGTNSELAQNEAISTSNDKSQKTQTSASRERWDAPSRQVSSSNGLVSLPASRKHASQKGKFALVAKPSTFTSSEIKVSPSSENDSKSAGRIEIAGKKNSQSMLFEDLGTPSSESLVEPSPRLSSVKEADLPLQMKNGSGNDTGDNAKIGGQPMKSITPGTSRLETQDELIDSAATHGRSEPHINQVYPTTEAQISRSNSMPHIDIRGSPLMLKFRLPLPEEAVNQGMNADPISEKAQEIKSSVDSVSTLSGHSLARPQSTPPTHTIALPPAVQPIRNGPSTRGQTQVDSAVHLKLFNLDGTPIFAADKDTKASSCHSAPSKSNQASSRPKPAPFSGNQAPKPVHHPVNSPRIKQQSAVIAERVATHVLTRADIRIYQQVASNIGIKGKSRIHPPYDSTAKAHFSLLCSPYKSLREVPRIGNGRKYSVGIPPNDASALFARLFTTKPIAASGANFSASEKGASSENSQSNVSTSRKDAETEAFPLVAAAARPEKTANASENRSMEHGGSIAKQTIDSASDTEHDTQPTRLASEGPSQTPSTQATGPSKPKKLSFGGTADVPTNIRDSTEHIDRVLQTTNEPMATSASEGSTPAGISASGNPLTGIRMGEDPCGKLEGNSRLKASTPTAPTSTQDPLLALTNRDVAAVVHPKDTSNNSSSVDQRNGETGATRLSDTSAVKAPAAREESGQSLQVPTASPRVWPRSNPESLPVNSPAPHGDAVKPPGPKRPALLNQFIKPRLKASNDEANSVVSLSDTDTESSDSERSNRRKSVVAPPRTSAKLAVRSSATLPASVSGSAQPNVPTALMVSKEVTAAEPKVAGTTVASDEQRPSPLSRGRLSKLGLKSFNTLPRSHSVFEQEKHPSPPNNRSSGSSIMAALQTNADEFSPDNSSSGDSSDSSDDSDDRSLVNKAKHNVAGALSFMKLL